MKRTTEGDQVTGGVKKAYEELTDLEKLQKQWHKLSADKRNAIAHQGEFCNEVEAKAAIGHAREFITGLVGIYDSSFRLTNGKG